jgi:tetratricopeptide (TPR) repeat protein
MRSWRRSRQSAAPTPNVLEVRWQIYVSLEKWEDALDLANAVARALPNEPKGYI